MKILSAALTLFLMFTSAIGAVPEPTIQEVYIGQQRLNELMQAAQSGDADAQFNLGEMFEKGSGVPLDTGRAFIWFERAAKQNHQQARFNLASMYYRGEGTETNPGKAFQLMEQLAKGGYARAQFSLGLMYETGIFIKRDVEQATKWYQRAAVGGYTPALMTLADFPQSVPALSPVEDGFGAHDIAPTPPPGSLLSEAARGTDLNALDGKNTEAPPAHTPLPAATNVASARPALDLLPAATALLANGNWILESNLPVEFLPSSVTSCEQSRTGGLECLSKEIISHVARTDIVYQTRATVSAVQPTGEFQVSYRNNVLRILRDLDPEDPDPRSHSGLTIGLGWQHTEHHLACKLEGGRTVNCVKNKTLKLVIKLQPAS